MRLYNRLAVTLRSSTSRVTFAQPASLARRKTSSISARPTPLRRCSPVTAKSWMLINGPAGKSRKAAETDGNAHVDPGFAGEQHEGMGIFKQAGRQPRPRRFRERPRLPLRGARVFVDESDHRRGIGSVAQISVANF